MNKNYSHIINLFEKKINAHIRLASLGGSLGMGLQGQSSDIDLFMIADEFQERVIAGFHDIDDEVDIYCCAEGYCIDSAREWIEEKHKYPTFLYKDKKKDENNCMIEAWKRDDYVRCFIIQIINADLLLRNTYTIEEFARYNVCLRIIDAMDYYFTRAYGNYITYLNQNEVQIRKYLTTLYGLYMMEHIIRTGQNGSSFKKMFDLYEKSSCRETIANLYETNKVSSTGVKIPANEMLQDYIAQNLEKYNTEIVKLSIEGNNEVLKYSNI